MPEYAPTKVIRTHLREHPAFQAWQEIESGRVLPQAIATLVERPGKKGKSAVYRLESVGPRGSAVIAKRCRQANAHTERTIYEDILPQLPVPPLRYYGFVEEPDGEFCWLFVECASGEQYSPLIQEHRLLAARWLALVHSTASTVAASAHLPDRGPAHYLYHLRSARDTILRNLGNRALGTGDVLFLRAIISRCDYLEPRWRQVERFCEGTPRTLVHGDFVGKNVRIRSGQYGSALLPFDWETAGWGVPAVDLAQSALPPTTFLANPELATYRSLVRGCWPALDLATIERLANYGKIFRCLAAIHWEARSLEYQWVEWPLKNIAVYEAELVDAMRAAGWEA